MNAYATSLATSTVTALPASSDSHVTTVFSRYLLKMPSYSFFSSPVLFL